MRYRRCHSKDRLTARGTEACDLARRQGEVTVRTCPKSGLRHRPSTEFKDQGTRDIVHGKGRPPCSLSLKRAGSRPVNGTALDHLHPGSRNIGRSAASSHSGGQTDGVAAALSVFDFKSSGRNNCAMTGEPDATASVGALAEEAIAANLASGQAALGRGDWATARASFEKVLASEGHAAALEGLGRATWWLEDLESTFRVRERAFQLYREAQDSRSAARIATHLALDYLEFQGELCVAMAGCSAPKAF